MPASGPEPHGHNVAPDIEQLLDDLADAVVSADLDALRDLLETEITWVYSGGSGVVRGTNAVLGAWSRHFQMWEDVCIQRRDAAVRVHGDVAWASFLWDGEGTARGSRYRLEGERLSAVMMRTGPRWRFALVHSSMPYHDWEDHRMPSR